MHNSGYILCFRYHGTVNCFSHAGMERWDCSREVQGEAVPGAASTVIRVFAPKGIPGS